MFNLLALVLRSYCVVLSDDTFSYNPRGVYNCFGNFSLVLVYFLGLGTLTRPARARQILC